MENVKELFSLAELAQAAYANLSQGATNVQENLDELEGSENGAAMTHKQAQEFAARHPDVVIQYDDPDTGFDTTVFRDTNGQLTLAIRGTTLGDDGDVIPTDMDIWRHGAGYDQIVAMYNWWQTVSSPAGATVDQFALASYKEGFDPVPSGIIKRSINNRQYSLRGNAACTLIS